MWPVFSTVSIVWVHSLLLIKRYKLYKVLACSTAFFQLSLFCAIFFQLCTFIFLISSKTSFSQRVLGLPIGLLVMGFHLLIFWTLLSSAMRSTWPNQFNLCFLINPIIFRSFSISLISWLVLILRYPSSVFGCIKNTKFQRMNISVSEWTSSAWWKKRYTVLDPVVTVSFIRW